MFRTVFYVHHQEFKTVHTATGICQTDTAVCLLAGTRCNTGASSWFCCRNNIKVHGSMKVKSHGSLLPRSKLNCFHPVVYIPSFSLSPPSLHNIYCWLMFS